MFFGAFSRGRSRSAILLVALGLVASVLLLAGILIPRVTTHGAGDLTSLAGSSPGLAARPQGGDFRLQTDAGALDLAELRGKVVLIYFGYTSCPDICPTNLAIIASALRRLSAAERARVRVLFVSVDPERDTPTRLAEYAGYFHPNILGLTGTPDAVARAASLYGARYGREPSESAMGYLVYHTAYTYVVDPTGRLVERLDHATPPEEVLQVIRDQL